jgi:chemotaxis protein methyltransferase CheR
MNMSPAGQKKSDDYQALLVVLQDVLGVVVDDENHAPVRQKLESVMAEHGFDSYTELAEALGEKPSNGLLSSVLQSITTHDSEWFGYSDVNTLLQEYVLPGIISGNKAEFRLWIVGCGHGQIAYSTAVVIEEFRQQHDMTCSIEIVATDLSKPAINQAVDGRYDSSMLASLPLAYKQKYMNAHNDQWEVDQVLKSMLQFKVCNLLEPFNDMGHFDLIICPDVMVYFSSGVKSEILREFAELLDSSGILIAGTNEPVVPFCKNFELVNHEAGVFYRQISA